MTAENQQIILDICIFIGVKIIAQSTSSLANKEFLDLKVFRELTLEAFSTSAVKSEYNIISNMKHVVVLDI